MSDLRDDELTPEEARAFRLLAESGNPATTNEDRIVAALRERGLLGARRSGRAPWAKGLAIAASLVAAFFLGAQYGRSERGGAPAAVEPRPAAEASASDVLLTKASDVGETVVVNCDDPAFLYDPQCYAAKTVGW